MNGITGSLLLALVVLLLLGIRAAADRRRAGSPPAPAAEPAAGRLVYKPARGIVPGRSDEGGATQADSAGSGPTLPGSGRGLTARTGPPAQAQPLPVLLPFPVSEPPAPMPTTGAFSAELRMDRNWLPDFMPAPKAPEQPGD